jgi:hypothetical protein
LGKTGKAKKKEKLLWIILISMVTALRVCVENVARRDDTSRREARQRDEKDLASHRREKTEDVLLTRRVLERHHRSTASIRDIVAQLKRSSGCVLYELRIFNFCL